MYCPRCGAENKSNAEKCEKCGISFKVRNGTSKKCLKKFFHIVLWIIAILALSLSFITTENINGGKISNESSFQKLEEKVVKLEEQYAMLEEELEEMRAGVENHIHTQYELIPYYQGKSEELQFEEATVLFENGSSRVEVGVGGPG